MMYREVAYPLNVFLHVLTREHGAVPALHYGLFDSPADDIALAQDRSTALLLARLPASPARLLDVGAGLGTLLRRLIDLGYDAEGLTPDAQQVALAHARDAGLRQRLRCLRFEDVGPDTFGAGARFDAVIFQESSQYIDPAALWRTVRPLTSRVIVLDEFIVQPPAAMGDTHHHLRLLAEFLACAAAAGFRVAEHLDLSRQAAPTIDYFLARIPRCREELLRELGVSTQQIDDLLASGARYRELYRRGVYGYRLLDLAA